MWSKFWHSRALRWVAVSLLAIAVLGGVTAYGLLEHWLPYRNAQNTMPTDGVLELYEQADGTLRLEWPQGENADGYTLEILRPETVGTETEEILYAYTTAGARSCLLPELPTDTELTIRVRSYANYRDKSRLGEQALSVTTVLAVPRIRNLTWTTDADTDKVRIKFDLEENSTCRVYITDAGAQAELVQSLTQGEAELAFGKDTQFPVPAFDGGYTLSFDVCRQTPGLVFYGNTCAQFDLCREDFLGTVLNLDSADLGNNAFELTWNETKGDHYEVQQQDGEEWKTLQSVARDAELVYHTGHLAKFKEFRFRVIAVGGQVDTITSEAVSVTTGAAAVYSTVWPLQELDIYADTDRKEVVGKAPAAQAYCVLEEADGLFGIRFEDGIGYIDSNYCMINLPEYIEDLCEYDITNSYSSIYMVHDYEIPEVTDTVVAGYEQVAMGEDTYLVPFLYPSAKKLVAAAFAAREQGYKLKIYDSFRPRKATNSIYDLTGKIISDLIPEYTFAEKQEMIEAGTWQEPGEGAPEEETAPQQTEPTVTYEILMTDNGRYSLSNFLARGYSNHNLGVALDLTLIQLPDGAQVEMQTAMHDLSWYSELKLNNDAAKALQKIMVGAGFGTLKSEWWHFQDNDAKDTLDLQTLQQGVSAACWMRDDDGWRYRNADGSYYVNCRKIIDGVTYHFDENGYVTEN